MSSEVKIRVAGTDALAWLPGSPGIGKPGLIIIHAWWGLNEEIEEQAEHYGEIGYTTIAVDLYRSEVTEMPERAMQLMNALDPAYAEQVLQGWVAWLRTERQCPLVGVVGYSLGGSWALNLACRGGVDAAVIYYGSLDKTAEELAGVTCPILAHMGADDHVYPVVHAEHFGRTMQAAGKDAAVHVYPAAHGFARLGDAEFAPDFAPESVAAAWGRTVAFLQQHLPGAAG